MAARPANEHPNQVHHVSTLSATPSPSPRTSQIAEAGVGAPKPTIVSQGFLPSAQMRPMSPPLQLPVPTDSPQPDCAKPTSSSSINASVPPVPTHQPPVSPTTVPLPDSSVSLPILNDSLDHQCTISPASNLINSTASHSHSSSGSYIRNCSSSSTSPIFDPYIRRDWLSAVQQR